MKSLKDGADGAGCSRPTTTREDAQGGTHDVRPTSPTAPLFRLPQVTPEGQWLATRTTLQAVQSTQGGQDVHLWNVAEGVVTDEKHCGHWQWNSNVFIKSTDLNWTLWNCGSILNKVVHISFAIHNNRHITDHLWNWHFHVLSSLSVKGVFFLSLNQPETSCYDHKTNTNKYPWTVSQLSVMGKTTSCLVVTLIGFIVALTQGQSYPAPYPYPWCTPYCPRGRQGRLGGRHSNADHHGGHPKGNPQCPPSQPWCTILPGSKPNTPKASALQQKSLFPLYKLPKGQQAFMNEI